MSVKLDQGSTFSLPEGRLDPVIYATVFTPSWDGGCGRLRPRPLPLLTTRLLS